MSMFTPIVNWFLGLKNYQKVVASSWVPLLFGAIAILPRQACTEYERVSFSNKAHAMVCVGESTTTPAPPEAYLFAVLCVLTSVAMLVWAYSLSQKQYEDDSTRKLHELREKREYWAEKTRREKEDPPKVRRIVTTRKSRPGGFETVGLDPDLWRELYGDEEGDKEGQEEVRISSTHHTSQAVAVSPRVWARCKEKGMTYEETKQYVESGVEDLEEWVVLQKKGKE